MHSYHDNSKTSIHRRSVIKSDASRLTCRAQARIEQVGVATIHKWRHRSGDDLADRSSRPHRIRCAFDESAERLVLRLRRTGLALDALLDAVEQAVPTATRSSVWRLLVRHGLQRLPSPERPAHGSYDDEDREPGFLHVDSFVLQCLPGQGRSQSHRHHCFAAVDRATRMAFLHVYGDCSGESACDFLSRCREFFPFRIGTILTDNGGQYTLKATAPIQHRKGRRRPFEEMCAEHGIVHKTTKPYTPRTNGLVERVNGIVQQQAVQGRGHQDRRRRDQALADWLDNYNLVRKHRNIPIGRMTPLEAAMKWHDRNPDIFHRQPQRQHLSMKSCSQRPGT